MCHGRAGEGTTWIHSPGMPTSASWPLRVHDEGEPRAERDDVTRVQRFGCGIHGAGVSVQR